MRALLFTSMMLVFAACGGEEALPDAAPPDASCGAPLDCATWLQDYEREIVSKITGHSELSPGLSVHSRFTPEERDAVRGYIVDQLNAHGHQAQLHDYGSGANVFARLPATRDGAKLIVLGCHFDGIEGSPAAGDDGTGVALVLAAARYFAQLSERENEMIFAFFDEEEDGLVGSQAYAEKLRMEDPDLAAAHIFDLISWDEDEDGAVELWSPADELASRYQAVGEERGVPVRIVDFESSDHASFIGQGFASVGVSEEFVSGDFNPNYHTPEDVYENINFDYLESITRLALVVTSGAH